MLIAMDEKAGWARTYSRYYALGTKRDLTITPLGRLTKAERREIDAEGERLRDFFHS